MNQADTENKRTNDPDSIGTSHEKSDQTPPAKENSQASLKGSARRFTEEAGFGTVMLDISKELEMLKAKRSAPAVPVPTPEEPPAEVAPEQQTIEEPETEQPDIPPEMDYEGTVVIVRSLSRQDAVTAELEKPLMPPTLVEPVLDFPVLESITETEVEQEQEPEPIESEPESDESEPTPDDGDANDMEQAVAEHLDADDNTEQPEPVQPSDDEPESDHPEPERPEKEPGTKSTYDFYDEDSLPDPSPDEKVPDIDLENPDEIFLAEVFEKTVIAVQPITAITSTPETEQQDLSEEPAPPEPEDADYDDGTVDIRAVLSDEIKQELPEALVETLPEQPVLPQDLPVPAEVPSPASSTYVAPVAPTPVKPAPPAAPPAPVQPPKPLVAAPVYQPQPAPAPVSRRAPMVISVVFIILVLIMTTLSAMTSILYPVSIPVAPDTDLHIQDEEDPTQCTIRYRDGLCILGMDGFDVILVNQDHMLPESYGKGVDAEALAAFNDMRAAAERQGIALFNVNDYRSYFSQQVLYNRIIAYHGADVADEYECRPGMCEHQLGVAFDVAGEDSADMVQYSFSHSVEFEWLVRNCADYGFILRYPENKTNLTMHRFEPWHFRYVGQTWARYLCDNNLVLEECVDLARPID